MGKQHMMVKVCNASREPSRNVSFFTLYASQFMFSTQFLTLLTFYKEKLHIDHLWEFKGYKLKREFSVIDF